MECPICCEKFTIRTRKEVKCPSPECSQSVCLQCFKRFILESEDIMPKCMFCSKELSYSFVRENTAVSWANKEYLCRRTEHLMAREKSLLPESQYDVRKKLDLRKCREEEAKIFQEIHKKQREINELYTERDHIFREYNEKYRIDKIKEKIVTKRRCALEDCEGYLDDKWICGICDSECCSSCGVVKEEEHVCDKNTKATFKAIENDTRPCPRCAIPIHKWEGCNQMYCTQCGCMFDYRTGRLETGYFHNPHYFEALRNGTIQQRNHGDQRACGMPGAFNMMQRFRTLFSGMGDRYKQNNRRKLGELYSLVGHITEISLPDTYSERKFDQKCRTMRRDYLLKELEEKEWFDELKIIEKEREMNTEISQLLTLFRDVGRDAIINIDEMLIKLQHVYNPVRDMSNGLPSLELNGILIQPYDYLIQELEGVEKIAAFFNEKMLDMQKKFKRKMPFICLNFARNDCKGI